MAEQSMAEKVKAVYPTKAWARKVDRMTHDQLVAVYMRLKLQGKVS